MIGDQRYRRLEVQHRRPGAAHPDRCMKLRLAGVPFALPARGMRITPRFDSDGRVQLELVSADQWLDTTNLLDRAAEALTGSVLTLDTDAAEGLLCDLIALARRALLVQYDLSDDQLAELLGFATDERPHWIGDLLHWAQGLNLIHCHGGMPRQQHPKWWRWFGRGERKSTGVRVDHHH